jgi:flagellin FlaB
MGKITKKLKADDIGDMGIGAMIVFIAMVLVAGIAASVLIQTANRLEIQAMITGQETIGEVATGVGVAAIVGFRNDTQENLSLMSIEIEPRAGSQSVDLGETFVEISDSQTKVVLMYGGTAMFEDTPAIAGDIFGNCFPGGIGGLNETRFGVVVLLDADDSLSGAHPVLNRGDQVVLTFNLSAIFPQTGYGGLPPRTSVWGVIQPEQGAPGVFSFTTPASYAANLVYDLY